MSDPGNLLRPRDRQELEGLEHQHRVWQAGTTRTLDAAGFGPGQRLLDLGCGPGFLTLELGLRGGTAGRGAGRRDRPW